MREPQEQEASAQGLDRLKGLTDALYAVAFTFLAIEIGLPEIEEGLTPAEFGAELAQLGRQFLVYAQTFLILGVYWVFHHYAFRYIRRNDEALVWLNLAVLLFVGFVPIPTALAARRPLQDLALLLYGIFLALVGLADLGLWAYATGRGRLVDPDLDPNSIRDLFLWGVAPLIASLALIVLALVAPVAALSFFPWLLLTLLVVIVIYRLGTGRLSLDQ